MTSAAPRPETIEKLASAVYPSFAMLAGMQLDLFTPLKDGPLTAAQLAGALGVRADKLQPLLYALVAAGLLTVDGERFANTPEAGHFLVRGKATYQGGRHERLLPQWLGLLKTAETVRTGLPQAKVDFAAMPEEELGAFYRGGHGQTLAAGRDLAARYDFSSYRSLVDVAGGSGGLAIALTESYPQLQATVLDLPPVTPITRRFVDEARAGQRVQVVAADVVKGPLKGSYDVAVMRSFIQVLSRKQAAHALVNVAGVLEPGGMLYILGAIMDDSHLSPPELVAENLDFLNRFDQGQVYTESEYREWLAAAGFADFHRVAAPNSRSIVTARKPV